MDRLLTRGDELFHEVRAGVVLVGRAPPIRVVCGADAGERVVFSVGCVPVLVGRRDGSSEPVIRRGQRRIVRRRRPGGRPHVFLVRCGQPAAVELDDGRDPLRICRFGHAGRGVAHLRDVRVRDGREQRRGARRLTDGVVRAGRGRGAVEPDGPALGVVGRLRRGDGAGSWAGAPRAGGCAFGREVLHPVGADGSAQQVEVGDAVEGPGRAVRGHALGLRLPVAKAVSRRVRPGALLIGERSCGWRGARDDPVGVGFAAAELVIPNERRRARRRAEAQTGRIGVAARLLDHRCRPGAVTRTEDVRRFAARVRIFEALARPVATVERRPHRHRPAPLVVGGPRDRTVCVNGFCELAVPAVEDIGAVGAADVRRRRGVDAVVVRARGFAERVLHLEGERAGPVPRGGRAEAGRIGDLRNVPGTVRVI